MEHFQEAANSVSIVDATFAIMENLTQQNLWLAVALVLVLLSTIARYTQQRDTTNTLCATATAENENKTLRLALSYRATGQQAAKKTAMQKLKSLRYKSAVVEAHVGHPANMNISSQQIDEAVEQLLHQMMSQLPHMQKVGLYFSFPFPIMVLSDLLRKQRKQRKQTLLQLWSRKKYTPNEGRIRDLKLCLPEWAGSHLQKTDFFAALQQASSLRSLVVDFKIKFNLDQMVYADAANINDLQRRRQQNEQDVIRLVQALKQSPSLEDLHIRVALPPRTAAINKDLAPYIDCSLVTSLVSLVQTSATLKTLHLGLCRQASLPQSAPDDRWYISAFATALSNISNKSSQLQQLRLEACHVENTMEEQSALDAMGGNLLCLRTCEISYRKPGGDLEACISMLANLTAGGNTARSRPPLCYRDKNGNMLAAKPVGTQAAFDGSEFAQRLGGGFGTIRERPQPDISLA